MEGDGEREREGGREGRRRGPNLIANVLEVSQLCTPVALHKFVEDGL